MGLIPPSYTLSLCVAITPIKILAAILELLCLQRLPKAFCLVLGRLCWSNVNQPPSWLWQRLVEYGSVGPLEIMAPAAKREVFKVGVSPILTTKTPCQSPLEALIDKIKKRYLLSALDRRRRRRIDNCVTKADWGDQASYARHDVADLPMSPLEIHNGDIITVLQIETTPHWGDARVSC